MPDKKLSKKIIKDSKKIARASKKAMRDSKKTGRMDAIKKLSTVKGKAEPKRKKDPATGFKKGVTPMIPGQYESKVKRAVKEGIKNSGMRKAAKKKREAAKTSEYPTYKKTTRGTKVVEKIDGKRYVTKYDKSGRVRKTKGMGYKTKHKAGKIVKEKGRNK